MMYYGNVLYAHGGLDKLLLGKGPFMAVLRRSAIIPFLTYDNNDFT
jgi:hypothetical protein